MTTTTMHFGPEWMRTKSSQSLTQLNTPSSPTAPPSSASYSSLLSPAPVPQTEQRDEANPFRYTKEEMLRIYRENLSKTGLGLEVERWEGVVRETAAEPISLRAMSEAEEKLFAGPLNSELRRRQSSDYLSPLSTQNLGSDRNRINSAALSPLRDRFGNSGMKRRDSADHLPSVPPRKLSLSGSQPLASPAQPSPRTRYFDGVLNGGEAWMARRRASEGLLRGGTVREPSGDDGDNGGMKIKEEDETAQEADPGPVQLHTEPLPIDSTNGQAGLENGVAQLHLDMPAPTTVPTGPPPGLDLASIEWSYLDPQGQIQGPFRAETMQKWHDEGYFAPDLLMKRTNIDKDWISVGNLTRQSLGEKIFLSPFAPTLPPGINRRTDSPQHLATLQDPSLFNGPYQPSPVRSLRSSTLDLNIGSDASSPASSFGAGRFSNESPDPGAFVSSSYSSTDPMLGSRVGSFTAEPSLMGRRNTFTEVPVDLNLAGVLGGVAGRAGSTDSFVYNTSLGPAAGTWPSASSSLEPMALSSNLGPGATAAPRAYSNHLQPQDNSFGDPSSGNVPFDFGFVDTTNQPLNRVDTTYSGLASLAYSPQQQFPAAKPGIMPTLTATTTTRVASHTNGWPTTSDAQELRRPGPFDATHPTSSNTVVMNSGWGPEPTSQVVLPHNNTEPLQQVSPEEPSPTIPALPQNEEPVAPASAAAEPAVETPAAAPTAKKSRAKTATQTPTIITPAAAPETPAPPPPASAGPPKPAWAKDEDKRKASGISRSLREIQDAEMRKAEARKAAEKERERSARPAVTPSSEDTMAFTTSWGLPTSQAGSRVSQSKDTPATPSPSTSGSHVWTTAVKPSAPKTMKEIQEEEERRKKMATKETAAAIAARRGYADSASVPKTVPQATQNAWTTIGANGKVNARPSITTASVAGSSTSVPRSNGVAVAATRSPASNSVKTSPVKADDTPAPSHEFVKWLNESLKGLNNSVNVEEIMSMLLSFPLDPDPSTIELISDLIYANSTTLDGRRFAAEFINRRKSDAASRPKGGLSNAGGAGKPVSIADVVKAQPKSPASSEWGGFKVVNKKKKGGK